MKSTSHRHVTLSRRNTSLALFTSLFALLAMQPGCVQRKFGNVPASNATNFWGNGDAGVNGIELPVDRSNPAKGNFNFIYQLRKNPEDTSKTLLVHFVGGPGGAGIGRSPVISRFAQIDMDIRGVGKNSNQKLQPESSFTSEIFALDILDIIKSKKEEFDKIIILGESYGTVPATILANLIEQSNNSPEGNFPKVAAVYLDSTVARAFEGTRGDIRKGFQRVWNAELKLASPELINELKSESPFGENSLFLGNLVAGESFSLSKDGNPPLNALRKKLENEVKGNDAKQYFKRSVNDFERRQMSQEHRALAPSGVYGHVMCSELAREGHEADILLVDGKVEFVKTNLCSAGKFDFKAFDSKNYSYSAPTYYFVGGMDPVTEMEDTEYHAQNANKSKTSMTMLLPMGTHISFTSVFGYCRGSAIEAYADPIAVGKGLEKCSGAFKYYSNIDK